MTDATAVTDPDPWGDNVPRPTLSAEQRRLIGRAKTANEKAKKAEATHAGALAARDDLIRQARAEGVTDTVLSEALGLNRGLIWKIHKGLTTREYERKRGGGT